jgi:hypothetical protein
MPGWNNLPFLAAREILAFLGVGTLYGLFIKYQAVALQSAAQARTFRNIALLHTVRPRAVLHHGRLGLRDDADAGLGQRDLRDVPLRQLLRHDAVGAGADRDGADAQAGADRPPGSTFSITSRS